MNKEHFQALIDMGYSAREALELLEEDLPKSEPKPEQEPEPEPEQKPEPEPEESADPMDSIREDMKSFQDAVNKSIQELTRTIQRMNIRTMGTDEDPNVNRADEFLAQLIKGGK